MADHDQRLKVLLREFFKEFVWLFFPEWAERFDFDTISGRRTCSAWHCRR